MMRENVKRDQSASRNHVSRFIGVTTQNPVEPQLENPCENAERRATDCQRLVSLFDLLRLLFASRLAGRLRGLALGATTIAANAALILILLALFDQHDRNAIADWIAVAVARVEQELPIFH
jgi:hypothetical protein